MDTSSLTRSRWAVGSIFFLHGICFSTWGARIPSIQTEFHLSEVQLGTLLFAIPIGSFLSMPFATWATHHFGSRSTLRIALLGYASFLFLLSLAPTPLVLGATLILFGCFSNTVNISVNTQAVLTEARMGRTVMASLHGLWSLAGFVGAALGALMLALQTPLPLHFAGVAFFVLLGYGLNSRHLLSDPPLARETPPVRELKKFRWPGREMRGLGLIAFCSMLAEGAMFDWSGVYFQNVIAAPPAWIGLGYASFMSTMAGTRFLADGLSARHGRIRVLQLSGGALSLGLWLPVLFPTLPMGILGFLLVGAGTSAVVPLVFSEAGRQSKGSTSQAIAAVSTIGFLGFLIGPPLIGWIAGLTSLRVSFALIGLMGLTIALFVHLPFRAKVEG